MSSLNRIFIFTFVDIHIINIAYYKNVFTISMIEACTSCAGCFYYNSNNNYDRYKVINCSYIYACVRLQQIYFRGANRYCVAKHKVKTYSCFNPSQPFYTLPLI